MYWKRSLIVFTVILLIVLGSSSVIAGGHHREPTVEMIVSGLEGASGSTVGPDGALYVTEGAAGRVSRVDPNSGDVTTFVSGLPQAIAPIGGAVDVAFRDGIGYVLVTMVGHDFGGDEVVGIYRVDGLASATPIADIGQFSLDNPPDADFVLETGVQYAMETFRGGFLVTDGHHNRVLRVTMDGEVSEMETFGNIVPTGLEVHGNTIFMAEAGPNPHLPEDGKIVSFGPNTPDVSLVASGAPLLVDVEYGLGRTLYGLSQGIFELGNPDGAPANPNTGALVEVNSDGTFTVVVDRLNIPTSVDFIGNTAFVVTLTGEIWKIENTSSPPFGRGH